MCTFCFSTWYSYSECTLCSMVYWFTWLILWADYQLVAINAIISINPLNIYRFPPPPLLFSSDIMYGRGDGGESIFGTVFEGEYGMWTLPVESQKGVIAVEKMFHWEPEGCYRCTKSMALAPFWFLMEHLWTAIMPLWLSTDSIIWYPRAGMCSGLTLWFSVFVIFWQSNHFSVYYSSEVWMHKMQLENCVLAVFLDCFGLTFRYCTSWNFRGGFIFANFASQTLTKISTSFYVYLIFIVMTTSAKSRN